MENNKTNISEEPRFETELKLNEKGISSLD